MSESVKFSRTTPAPVKKAAKNRGMRVLTLTGSEVEPARHSGDLSDLISTLKSRAPRVALAIALAQAARPFAIRARDWLDERSHYTVAIRGDDEAYGFVHEWLLSALPPSSQRSLVAFSNRVKKNGNWTWDTGLLYDGRYECDIRIGSHKVTAAISEGRFAAEGSEGGVYKPPELMFTAKSAAGRDAVVSQISKMVQKLSNDDRLPQVRIHAEWGWESLDEVPPRPLDSVILAPGQAERIVADMRRFLEAEDFYVQRGMPWHRGYLFTGPPRTGKTSFARALAGHFKMDLWCISLGDIRKDGDLLKQVAKISPRSVLLLEDADIYHAATQRDDETEGRVTLAGLLNATDGVVTPHGLIMIMTGNEPGRLDRALVQPGRIDVIEEFGLCSDGQAREIISHYYEGAAVPAAENAVTLDGISPAAVVEACKRAATPASALAALMTSAGKPAK